MSKLAEKNGVTQVVTQVLFLAKKMVQFIDYVNNLGYIISFGGYIV